MFEGVFSFKWMDDVEFALLLDAGLAATQPAGTAAVPTRTAREAMGSAQDGPSDPKLLGSDGGAENGAVKFESREMSACARPLSPAPPPPAPPPPPSSLPLPSTPSAALKSPPLMSSPAFAAALQSVVLNKTPKPNAPSSARSIASPGMSKGDDLMAALVARISARRRRMTNTVAVRTP